MGSARLGQPFVGRPHARQLQVCCVVSEDDVLKGHALVLATEPQARRRHPSRSQLDSVGSLRGRPRTTPPDHLWSETAENVAQHRADLLFIQEPCGNEGAADGEEPRYRVATRPLDVPSRRDAQRRSADRSRGGRSRPRLASLRSDGTAPRGERRLTEYGRYFARLLPDAPLKDWSSHRSRRFTLRPPPLQDCRHPRVRRRIR
jgi:hypothetical protein